MLTFVWQVPFRKRLVLPFVASTALVLAACGAPSSSTDAVGSGPRVANADGTAYDLYAQTELTGNAWLAVAYLDAGGALDWYKPSEVMAIAPETKLAESICPGYDLEANEESEDAIEVEPGSARTTQGFAFDGMFARPVGTSTDQFGVEPITTTVFPLPFNERDTEQTETSIVPALVFSAEAVTMEITCQGIFASLDLQAGFNHILKSKLGAFDEAYFYTTDVDPDLFAWRLERIPSDQIFIGED